MSRFFYLISPRAKPVRLASDREYSFGRDHSSTFVLPDTTVSRRHATLMWSGAAFVLTDLESRNGTYVNDEPVREHELRDGDRVRIGSFEFQIRMESIEEAEGRYREERERFLSGETVAFDLPAAQLAQAGFSGKLEDFPLIDVVNALFYNGRTGRLSVQGRGGGGDLFFEQGELVHVASPPNDGETALADLLGVRSGSFGFEKDVAAPLRTIHRGTMTVILDTCRLLDERSSKAPGQD